MHVFYHDNYVCLSMILESVSVSSGVGTRCSACVLDWLWPTVHPTGWWRSSEGNSWSILQHALLITLQFKDFIYAPLKKQDKEGQVLLHHGFNLWYNFQVFLASTIVKFLKIDNIKNDNKRKNA